MDEREQGMDARSRGETVSAGGDNVLTLVCFKCGTEYYFAEGDPPASMTCDKCSNTVFRSFVSRDEESDEMSDFEDMTRRDMRPDDPEGDTLPGDLLDLGRI